jgi:hypothetical protein
MSRIINVGDLTFTGTDPSKARFPVRPGTTVEGRCIVTTFFSKPMDASPAPAGKNQPAHK